MKREYNTLFYMTMLMTVTTIIAGWHISDVWSGVVCLLCGLVTIGLSDELTKKKGGCKNGKN